MQKGNTGLAVATDLSVRVEKTTMAAANESRGLKIAVAALISLSVILTVTSFFLYSHVSIAEAKLGAERDARRNDKRAAALALTQYDEMRTRIGTKAQEFDPAMKEISANFEKVEERLDYLINAVNAAAQTAQQNGVQRTKAASRK